MNHGYGGWYLFGGQGPFAKDGDAKVDNTAVIQITDFLIVPRSTEIRQAQSNRLSARRQAGLTLDFILAAWHGTVGDPLFLLDFGN
jgi:hypothetical protein